ncbi:MAG: fatty acid desaturase [Deltaproteobacteria bacterium]|nr:fatty acid desaturase [Deltaproteobacteria bacterium]
MRKISMHYQVNIVKIAFHVGAIVGLCTLPIGNWWIASILGYFLFSRIGGDVGFHRYFTHKSFQASALVEKALLVLGTLDCKGSMFSWVTSHIAHHAHADKKGDPHSPHRIGFFKVWIVDWETFPVSGRSIAPYLRRPLYRFTHENYLWIIAVFAVGLGSINLHLLVYFYCVPMVCSIHMTGIINTVGHSLGYRNFNIDDESRNNLIVNFLSLGGGLHNNHHARPSSPSQATDRWFEIDPANAVIKLIRKKA